jgi:hypothetical protein
MKPTIEESPAINMNVNNSTAGGSVVAAEQVSNSFC